MFHSFTAKVLINQACFFHFYLPCSLFITQICFTNSGLEPYSKSALCNLSGSINLGKRIRVHRKELADHLLNCVKKRSGNLIKSIKLGQLAYESHIDIQRISNSLQIGKTRKILMAVIIRNRLK
jgi:hypothetical protein